MTFRRFFFQICNLHQKLHIFKKFQKNRIRMHKTRVYRWEHLRKVILVLKSKQISEVKSNFTLISSFRSTPVGEH